ncbi:DUF202 domain-containing protein [Nocardia takedensis]
MSDADLGMATQRTALAWRRTAIGAMAIALLFLHHAAVSGWRAAGVAPVVCAVAMVALAALCFARNRTLHRRRYGHGAAAVTLTAATVVLVACVAALLQIADPSL